MTLGRRPQPLAITAATALPGLPSTRGHWGDHVGSSWGRGRGGTGSGTKVPEWSPLAPLLRDASALSEDAFAKPYPPRTLKSQISSPSSDLAAIATSVVGDPMDMITLHEVGPGSSPEWRCEVGPKGAFLRRFGHKRLY